MAGAMRAKGRAGARRGRRRTPRATMWEQDAEIQERRCSGFTFAWYRLRVTSPAAVRERTSLAAGSDARPTSTTTGTSPGTGRLTGATGSSWGITWANASRARTARSSAPNSMRRIDSSGPGWQQALEFVQPRTFLTWQKKRFRDYWRRLSQTGKPGRPAISKAVRDLSRDMWCSNPTWGWPRIVGELRKLEITVVKSTLEKYRPRDRKPPSPTWKAFLNNHQKLRSRGNPHKKRHRLSLGR
jgi:hypothetical protein